MLCSRCGATNDDNAWKCVSCGGVIERPADLRIQTVRVKTYLIPAIFASCFCCMVPGIIAIVFASQVTAKVAEGDLDGARRYSSRAKLCVWLSVGLGIVFVALYIALTAMGVMAGRDTRPTPPPSILHSST